MYQALYRKWRPKTFDEVVGQKHITETLKNQISTGRTSHAYLFIGTRGTGKTTCAKILAKALNCEHPVDGNPCGKCPACLGIEDGSIMTSSRSTLRPITAWITSASCARRPCFLRFR